MMNDFFKIIRDYLLDYLPKQRNFSANTVNSYKQALSLFVSYLRFKENMKIDQICFNSISRQTIVSFLNWLENERNCNSSTSNHRLMVLRSFFDYAGRIDIAQIQLGLIAKDIHIKKHQPKLVEFLSESALESLLKQPDQSNHFGYRNLFFMILMYDTAARCGELLNAKIRDIIVNDKHSIMYLYGKGSKTRVVPLLNRTIEHYKIYLQKFHQSETLQSDKLLFYTTIHDVQQPMSADTVALFLKKYALMARKDCLEVPEKIHPHMLRHTRAMHLYQQKMPLPILSEILGHAKVETTKIYAYSDAEMKREAIEKADIFREGDEPPKCIWEGDEDMILRLSGLI
jgi:site-specific recombinase XerD